MSRGAKLRRIATAIAACGASALAAAGCGAGPPARAVGGLPGVRLSLVLHQDVGDHQLLACSLVHHYARFPLRRAIAFDGVLAPRPHRSDFKVKIKIKRCVEGRFQDSGAWDVRGARDGRYRGTLPVPGKGIFFARARYRTPAGTVLSDKIYFDVG